MRAMCVSKATLGRIPLYIQYLRDLPHDEDSTISATAIAKALCLGEVLVRKDLATISGAGKPRVGYVMTQLIQNLEEYLGNGELTPAVLVGAGRLGRALLEYDGFENYGVKIAASFDCNEQVLSLGGDRKILPIRTLNEFCREHDVKIGIITVGQGSAQEVCDQLVESGILAIWNFAPCRLNVPEHVILKQETLALSLAHLNSQLNQSLDD